MTHPEMTQATISSQEFTLFMNSLKNLAALKSHNDPDVFLLSLAQTMINFIPLKQESIVCCPSHIREYVHAQSEDLCKVFDEMLDATIEVFHRARAICDRKDVDA